MDWQGLSPRQKISLLVYSLHAVRIGEDYLVFLLTIGMDLSYFLRKGVSLAGFFCMLHTIIGPALRKLSKGPKKPSGETPSECWPFFGKKKKGGTWGYIRSDYEM